MKFQINKEQIQQYFHLPLEEAALKLGCCSSVLKRTCRQWGIKRWPYRRMKSLSKRHSQLEQQLSTLHDQYMKSKKQLEDVEGEMDIIIKEELSGIEEGATFIIDDTELLSDEGIINPITTNNTTTTVASNTNINTTIPPTTINNQQNQSKPYSNHYSSSSSIHPLLDNTLHHPSPQSSHVTLNNEKSMNSNTQSPHHHGSTTHNHQHNTLSNSSTYQNYDFMWGSNTTSTIPGTSSQHVPINNQFKCNPSTTPQHVEHVGHQYYQHQHVHANHHHQNNSLNNNNTTSYHHDHASSFSVGSGHNGSYERSKVNNNVSLSWNTDGSSQMQSSSSYTTNMINNAWPYSESVLHQQHVDSDTHVHESINTADYTNRGRRGFSYPNHKHDESCSPGKLSSNNDRLNNAINHIEPCFRPLVSTLDGLNVNAALTNERGLLMWFSKGLQEALPSYFNNQAVNKDYKKDDTFKGSTIDVYESFYRRRARHGTIRMIYVFFDRYVVVDCHGVMLDHYSSNQSKGCHYMWYLNVRKETDFSLISSFFNPSERNKALQFGIASTFELEE